MNIRIVLCIVLLQTVCCKAVSQHSLYSVPDKLVPNRYYRDLSDRLIISAYSYGIYNDLMIKSPANSMRLNYKTNSDYSIGMGFSYKWIGLYASYTPDFLNTDNNIYGNTDQFNLQLNSHGQRLGAYFNMHRIRGYYLKDHQRYLFSWLDSLAYPHRKDLNTFMLSCDLYYVFNHEHFSFRAPFNQADKQLRSAGSWLFVPFFSYFSFKADSSLVPVVDDPGNRYSINEANSLDFGLSFGYMYTFVFFKDFYLSLGGIPGIGVYNFDVPQIGLYTNSYHLKLAGKYQMIGILGYQGLKYMFSLRYVKNIWNKEIENDSDFYYGPGVLEFSVGYRFIQEKH